VKLYPILYLNEGPKTASESLEKGIVAVKIFSHIILLSKKRVFEAIRGIEKKSKEPIPEENSEEFETWKKNLSLRLGNRAIVGAITYEKLKGNLYSVNTSAGVNKFGPLAYQIAMYKMGDSWLRCDDSLREASLSVWQTMYDLSEKGVYERKWLGDWGWRNIPEAVYTWVDATNDTKTGEYLEGYIKKTEADIKAGGGDLDDTGFIDYLTKSPMKGGVGVMQYDMHTSPSKFGNFWAYRKTDHDPFIEDLFNDGEDMFDELKAEYGISPAAMTDIIEEGATRFFRRRYDTT
jgi:hypothetical protein